MEEILSWFEDRSKVKLVLFRKSIGLEIDFKRDDASTGNVFFSNESGLYFPEMN